MSANPHIRDKFSPLDTLAMQALRRYGDFSPGTVDGDTVLMFLEFANQIVDEVNAHPYGPSTPHSYYESISDARAIPDQVIVAGLLFMYAAQQGSDKTELYAPMFYKTMNQQLWLLINGNTRIRLRTMDGGTDKRHAVKTNPLNGLPIEDKE